MPEPSKYKYTNTAILRLGQQPLTNTEMKQQTENYKKSQQQNAPNFSLLKSFKHDSL